MTQRIVLVSLCAWLVGCASEGNPVPPGAIRSSTKDRVFDMVQSRLPQLKPGMTEEQSLAVLRDVPLGDEAVVSRTISGGKTSRYRITPRHQLELEFIPNGLREAPPGRLVAARIVE